MVQTRHSYSSVYVLLVSWERDDLGVAKEIGELARVFGALYGFQVEGFLIPNQDPDDVFADVLKDFVSRCQNPKSLLVVYYAGHGALNKSRLAHWYCHSGDNAPYVKWYSHQRILENSTSDVLLILDCCEPLGGGGYIRGGTAKQVLAACGFSSEAAGVGQHSFSNALIQELQASIGAPFTVQELHHRVSTRLRTISPGFGAEQRQNPILENLGEGGISNPSIRLVSYTLFPINLIALMGATGSGKSSLINRICGADVAVVGESQESMTKEVDHYATVVNGQSVILIDTPGFDDTYLSDRQVLERIAAYLYNYYQKGQKLTGLLYLRDINLDKMTGSARRNLDMFSKLCGEESFGNVVLLTTKWDKSPDLTAKNQHEKELVSKFWSDMIRLGCPQPKRVGKANNPELKTVDAITDVIEPMFKFEPTWLQIQRELGKYKDLAHTTVGQYIDQRLSNTIYDLKEAVESIRVQAARSGHPGIKAALIEEAENEEDRLKAAKNDKKALDTNIDDVVFSEAQRRRELVGYSMLHSIDTYLEELDVKDSKVRFWAVGIPGWILYEGCKYIWRKQGKARGLIQSAEFALD